MHGYIRSKTGQLQNAKYANIVKNIQEEQFIRD